MKWKQSKKLICEGITYICSNDKKIPIIEDDIYIVNSLVNKNQSDEELIRLVMEKENIDEISASLRMAEFVEKYGEMIDCPKEDVIFPI